MVDASDRGDNSTHELNSWSGVTLSDHLGELPPDGIGITVATRGTITTIVLVGEWDLATQPAIRAALEEVLARAPEFVVLDLRRLSFMDVAGLRMTVELHHRALDQNTRLLIVPGPRAVQRPYEICELTDALPFLA